MTQSGLGLPATEGLRSHHALTYSKGVVWFFCKPDDSLFVMPNLDFEVTQSDAGDPILDIVARVKATNEEMRGFARGLAEAAVKQGQHIAKSHAPRSGNMGRHEGGRIVDSIQTTEAVYAPGGTGGGGFFEARLYASGAIAPHLKYVYEGTKNEGMDKIFPAKGNLSGRLAIEKEGEGVHFRMWSRGQRAQTEWWDLAREAVEATLQSGIRDMDLVIQPHDR